MEEECARFAVLLLHLLPEGDAEGEMNLRNCFFNVSNFARRVKGLEV